MKNLGKFLQQIRKDTGLSLRKFKKKSGVTASHLCNIENGNRKPSFDCVFKILRSSGFGFDSTFFKEMGYQIMRDYSDE